jgi:hypothetical protein
LRDLSGKNLHQKKGELMECLMVKFKPQYCQKKKLCQYSELGTGKSRAQRLHSEFQASMDYKNLSQKI